MYVGLLDLDLTFLFYIVSGLQLHVDYFVGLRLLLSELCIRDVNTEYPIWYTHVSKHGNPDLVDMCVGVPICQKIKKV
jgi:hypothetical protein